MRRTSDRALGRRERRHSIKDGRIVSTHARRALPCRCDLSPSVADLLHPLSRSFAVRCRAYLISYLCLQVHNELPPSCLKPTCRVPVLLPSLLLPLQQCLVVWVVRADVGHHARSKHPAPKCRGPKPPPPPFPSSLAALLSRMSRCRRHDNAYLPQCILYTRCVSMLLPVERWMGLRERKKPRTTACR